MTTRVLAFETPNKWDYSTPLRELADWLEDHSDLVPVISAFGVEEDDEGVSLVVAIQHLKVPR